VWLLREGQPPEYTGFQPAILPLVLNSAIHGIPACHLASSLTNITSDVCITFKITCQYKLRSEEISQETSEGGTPISPPDGAEAMRTATVISQRRFKGEQLGRLAQGFHKTQIESTHFIEAFASLKSRKVGFYF
jgi:hypothetical protein